ncbi:MAG: hypothetical protein M5U19_22965 [Microthrixaceae bacterium]|nr:hypothetical protein [Microthrixaceae bacterium]
MTRPLGADPDTTIDQVAAWWLDNVAAPEVRPPTLHAYRKDVARLSERLARERWDRLVALAPNPQVGIVTSEPLTAVEVDRDSIVVCTATGGEVTITGEGLDNDHLDYGYAPHNPPRPGRHPRPLACTRRRRWPRARLRRHEPSPRWHDDPFHC